MTGIVNPNVVGAEGQQDGAIRETKSELLSVGLGISIPASKQAIRDSLSASTWDGMFAAIFSNVTGGVLLSNFLVELHATPTQLGLLASIPMLANLTQPLGAILGDRATSRHWYCFWVYGPARLLWLGLFGAILLVHWQIIDTQVLVPLTLAIVCISHFFGALGSASWLAWLATLVPRRLRGRYFGVRNSAANLTNLIFVPLLGFLVAAWWGGSLQGYGFALFLGIVAGLVSLGFQFFMVDVNPQLQKVKTLESEEFGEDIQHSKLNIENLDSHLAFLGDRNFLLFLGYFSLWMFAVNLSAPFFNIYMLDTLSIDLRWVTIYNSLQAGANLLMLVVWGKLADRFGNRTILLGVGVLVALTPLLWLGTGADQTSLWLWFPLLHILFGGTWAAIDLGNNNLQLGVAPVGNQASYFAIAAAVAGVSGAIGTTAGGFFAEFANSGGIPGLFALSAIVRLVALLPLILVHEQRGQSLREMMRVLFSGSKMTNPTEEGTAAYQDEK
jgi:MFS family permease